MQKIVNKDNFQLVSPAPSSVPVPLSSSTKTDTMVNIYPIITEVEALDFESIPRVHPSTQSHVSMIGKTFPTFEHK